MDNSLEGMLDRLVNILGKMACPENCECENCRIQKLAKTVITPEIQDKLNLFKATNPFECALLEAMTGAMKAEIESILDKHLLCLALLPKDSQDYAVQLIKLLATSLPFAAESFFSMARKDRVAKNRKRDEKLKQESSRNGVN